MTEAESQVVLKTLAEHNLVFDQITAPVPEIMDDCLHVASTRKQTCTEFWWGKNGLVRSHFKEEEEIYGDIMLKCILDS
jgi:hypothetical protein